MQDNKKFKARLGFDSNQETIINVGNPKDSLDAVNLNYYDYHNSITPYSEDRGYDKSHITNYKNQLYHALEDIASPAGSFNADKWMAVLSSPVWEKIDSENTTTHQIGNGAYLAVSTVSDTLELTLPQNPLEGETINILDIGANVGYNSLKVISRLNNIRDPKNQVNGVIKNINEIPLTIPRALYTFIYVTGFWELHSDLNEKFLYIPLGTSDLEYKAQSGIHLTNQSGNEEVTLYLPDHALNGDIISYEATGQSNTFVNVKFTPENTSTTINSNTKSFKFPTYSHLRFVYDSSIKTWISSYSNKLRKKTVVTSLEYSPLINEDVTVISYPDTEKTIEINLPKNAIENDTIEIYTNQTNSNVTVDIISDVDISYLPSSFGTQRYADHNIGDNYVYVKKLSFKPLDLRVSSITFIRKGKYWLIAKTDDFNFLACPANPEIAGVIELVPPSEMLADVMSRGNCAVTPRLLETRTPTESRKGIIEIATQDEVNLGIDDVRAVTPKKLKSLKSSETLEGIISLASQSEVDEGTVNNKAVTPLTLDNKIPNEEGKKGVVSLVSTTNTKPSTNRNTKGTGIYDYDISDLVVTPKSLHQLVSTTTSSGLSYMATDDEVLNGTATTVPTFVTPSALHKRTATTTRTGIAKLSTTANVGDSNNDTDIVTPKTLNSLVSTESRNGIIMLATEAKLTAKHNTSAVTPKLLSKKLEETTISTTTPEVSITGNLWEGITLDVSNEFKRPVYFSKKDNKLEDGYFFYIFKEGSSELSSALAWLTPPPTNKEGYDVIENGKSKQVVAEGEVPKYEGDYLYESYTKGNSVFEKLSIKDASYQRFSKVDDKNVVTNNGWTMIYNSLNKPTPKEIDAINVNDIIVGKVQIRDYLDIIVDSKNRLRIKPNIDATKDDELVSYLWLQSEKGVFNE